MRAPKFWQDKESLLGKILNPLGKVYALSVARRFKKARPYQADIPVICVGNLSIGGTGKTPVCLALGQILREMGVSFYFLNHGYKSEEQGVLIIPGETIVQDVGDEAMLLADLAPTVVDKNRARGAQIATKKGAQALIMDDGFQNPSLIKTLSFIVVDGKMGFGNERIIPAGPLREPIEKGISRADALIIVGDDQQHIEESIHKIEPDLPILKGRFVPQNLTELKNKKVAAFAGIGNPNKFFEMLKEKGLQVVKQTPFPDHYLYTRFDIEQLLIDAADLPLLTTSKDYVKVPPDMKDKVTLIKGNFVFDDLEEVKNLLKGIL